MAHSSSLFLVLDVGTSGIKAFLFDEQLNVVHKVYQAIGKQFPQPGWIEQDPHEILRISRTVMTQVVQESGCDVSAIVSCGITNQRETTILWNSLTGECAYPAIVWEDSRTQQWCEELAQEQESVVHSLTGLTINSYFSASKIHWILENVPQAQAWLEQGTLHFGTVDTWLLWNLLADKPHVTDFTNASRTLLFNTQSLQWDERLTTIFTVPQSILPKVLPSAGQYGVLDTSVLGTAIPLTAVCGDQQSSFYAAVSYMQSIQQSSLADLVAHGFTKITYGTGVFIMQLLGSEFQITDKQFTTLLPTPLQPTVTYACEAKVGAYGPQVAAALDQPEKVQPIFDEIAMKVAATLKEFPQPAQHIVVDGGMTQSNYLLTKQKEALGQDLSQLPIYDGTALGVAYLLKEHFPLL